MPKPEGKSRGVGNTVAIALSLEEGTLPSLDTRTPTKRRGRNASFQLNFRQKQASRPGSLSLFTFRSYPYSTYLHLNIEYNVS
jgi:hypothetical protein